MKFRRSHPGTAELVSSVECIQSEILGGHQVPLAFICAEAELLSEVQSVYKVCSYCG